MKYLGFLFSLLALILATPSQAQISDLLSGGSDAAQVSGSLVAEVKAAVPGQPFRVAVKLVHAKGSHTYGKVLPADVIGRPTSLRWTLPEGWKVEELPWPAVHQVPSTDGKMSEGYDGTVYLPATITPGGKVGDAGDITVKANVLVCDDKSCMPKTLDGTVQIKLAAVVENDPAAAEAFDKTASPGMPAPGATSPTSVPAPKAIEAPAVPAIAAAATAPAKAGPIETSVIKKVVTEQRSFGGFLLFAFVGGLILNVMPCVFPVLGIKILGVVQQAGGDKKQVVLHGLAYTAGVLLCFWALGGLVISLGKSWGFQLQSASFVFGLSVFFLIFSLNMAGLFEIGASAVGVGADLQAKHGLGGSFFSGLLATIVATPCSAPFLGSALGFAVTLPMAKGLLMFTMIGLGLASPFLLLSLVPSLVSKLPRPGAWMESFKQGMSFLLFGTVAYLVWVLTGMIEGQAMLFLLFGLVLVSLGCWIYGRWSLPHKPARTRLVAVVFTLAAVAGGLWLGWPQAVQAAHARGTSSSEGGLTWEAWSPERVAELRAANKPVYIDYTAKWCFTCQVNKRVYHDAALQTLIKEKGVVLLKADWTNEDPRISKALSDLGKAAVPVNVLYEPGKTEPVLLPELLSVENVSETFRTLK